MIAPTVATAVKTIALIDDQIRTLGIEQEQRTHSEGDDAADP